MFQKQYDAIKNDPDLNDLLFALDQLMKVDDKEMTEIFANELGNTWMMYWNKWRKKKKKLGAVCLKCYGDERTNNVPTLVFADAYESYSIQNRSEQSHVKGLSDAPGFPIFVEAQFENKVFDEKGGFDVDFITDSLIAVEEDIVQKPIYEKMKHLYVIKTLDLAFRAVELNLAAERFGELQKKDPFAFFALATYDAKPMLLCEIEGFDMSHWSFQAENIENESRSGLDCQKKEMIRMVG